MRRFLLLAFFFELFCASIAQDFTCSPSKPCDIGCCSNSGVCGLGPVFCGKGNCTSSCDAKSDCDPGWGSEWSSAEKCPLNVCCSEFGFCGTTSDFCGASDSVKRPSCSGSSSTGRTIGYYEGWSSTRTCDGVLPESLPVSGYTHINFAFAYIDPETFQVAFMTPGDGDLYNRVTAIRDLNPGLQVWLAIGGWSMNDPDQPTANTFSRLAASTAHQSTFASSLISMMFAYGFDGVDIDWEYPVAPERGGSKEDYANLPSWLSNLRRALTASGTTYGLSITLPSSYWYMQNFDISRIQHSVDWFNLMSYDLHGTWDQNATWTGPYVQAHTNLTEIEMSLDLLWRNDIDPDKVTLGLGFYGRSFTLQDPSCTKPGCVFSAGGNAGPCTGQVGILSYDEIMDVVSHGATVTYYEEAAVEVATFDGNQWVSYDDAKTLAQKILYANQRCLGGTMVWAVDLDKDGTAIGALSSSTQQQKRSLKSPNLADTVTQCKWTDCINTNQVCVGHGPKDGPCIETCPSGTSEAWSMTGDAVCDNDEYRLFCCPNNARTTCHVEDDTKFFCNGRCSGDEVQIGTTTNGCLTGSNAICCSRSNSLVAQEECSWSTTCSSIPTCANNKPNLIANSPFGDGSGAPCPGTQTKALCCSDPSPYSNCAWNRGPFGGTACQGICSDEQTIVATSSLYCTSGTQVLCCDGASNDAAAVQFELTLATFVLNPSCPADQIELYTELDPSQEPPLDENQDYRRDLSSLTKRDFSSLGGVGEMQTLVSIFSGGSSRTNLMRDAWDRLMGPTNLNSSEYLDIFNDNPEYDPAVLLQLYLCDWNHARQDIQQNNHVATESCVVPWGSTTTKRDLDNRKRTFNADLGSTVATTGRNSAINTGALLDRITNTNELPFLYARVIRYLNRGVAQANLEVVYDLRNAPDLQETPADIFAVFHFHTDSLDEDPNDTTAPHYPNVPFFHVYHGQRVFNANTNDPTNPTEWRVNYGQTAQLRGAGGVNRRTPINRCATGTTWYPGEFNTNLLENFGSLLRAQGILAPPTFHNWDEAAQRWNWDYTRPTVDYPNTGLFGQDFTVAPADMRPTSQGGSTNWPT